MKICIFGAGAVGGFIAAHLGRVENLEVSVVARGNHLKAIQQKGLRLQSPNGDFAVRVRATDNAKELGPQDVIFISLKQHQVTAALDEITSLFSPTTTIVPPTTGIPYWYFHRLPGPFENRQLDRLDPHRLQWRHLTPERAIGCVYWVACEVVEPGLIHHDGSFANFPIGEPDGCMSSRIEGLAKAMKAAGLQAPVVDNIRHWIWMKMISSLAWNPIATLTLATNGQIAKHPDVVELVRRIMGEAEALAANFGVVEMPMSIDQRVGLGLSITDHKMSMLQDLERNRPLEVAVLLDSVAAMRELCETRMPTTDIVCGLLALREATLHRS